jgi:hypothetical protein
MTASQTKTVLTPAETGHPVWVYRYSCDAGPWTLSIATHAEPGSRKLSLGGFRIAPAELTDEPGFDADRMAIGLALGMEEKVYWSRLVHVGGPLALRDRGRIVGGKCVMHPTADARVGAPRDVQMLDFALDCFRDVEESAGIHLTTGQDLGHGTLHDGRTGSLDYLSARHRGCVDADTSKPTGEGNFFVLAGMLAGLGVDLGRARVLLVGLGNIGLHVLGRLREHGAEVVGLEAKPERRRDAERLGARTHEPSEKARLLDEPFDAVVVNANKESLDLATCERIARNPRMRVVCGSENLAMPDPRGAELLRAAAKLYAPTEFGGMMGYLTAVEEYLAHLEGIPFDVRSIFDAAQRLEEVSREAASLAAARGFAIGFDEALREVFSEPVGQ